MPFDPRLLDALEASEVGVVVRGTVWRQILDPTSVMRPNQRGARWNPPGAEALYCSLNPETAAAEIDNLVNRQPVPITRERRTYAIEVRLERVIDLRPTPWAATFNYDYDINSLANCQEIGGAVSWLGISGLIVPSLRRDADNLVVFVANLEPDDAVNATEPYYVHPSGPPQEMTWTPLGIATSGTAT